MAEIFRLTKNRYDELKNELKERIKVLRPKIKVELVRAADQGDLVYENFPFDYANEKYIFNENRIREIRNILRDAQILESKSTKVVKLGSKVVLKRNDGSLLEVVLVESHEADSTKKRISKDSPLGKLLFNKKAGTIISSNESQTFTILEIS